MTKISIIIPTYNEEKYLSKTLESIKKQGFREYEIIVSDSESTDKTIEIAKEYGAIVVSGPKKGPGAARNLGAKKAKSDILFFMDADAELVSNDSLYMIKKTLENPKYDGGYFNFKGDGPFRYSFFWSLLNFISRINYILNKPSVPGYCFFIRKNVFEIVNGFDENVVMCEDLDISLRIARNTKSKLKYLKDYDVLNSTRRYKDGIIKTSWFYTKAFFHLFLFKSVPKDKFEFKSATELLDKK